MTQHTPGPWHVVQAANGRVSVYPLGGKERVLDVYCPLDRSEGTLGGNARLIAAAPEMYELVKALATVTGSTVGLFDKARALLARVEGR